MRICLLIKLERIDDNFYKSLIKFILDHGYTPEVVVRNTDSFSINGLEIISSKRQLFLHKKDPPGGPPLWQAGQTACIHRTGLANLSGKYRWGCPGFGLTIHNRQSKYVMTSLFCGT